MVSTSFETVSSSLMDEKSLPKPPKSPKSPDAASVLPPADVGVDHAVDVLATDVAMVTFSPASRLVGVPNEALLVFQVGSGVGVTQLVPGVADEP